MKERKTSVDIILPKLGMAEVLVSGHTSGVGRMSCGKLSLTYIECLAKKRCQSIMF